jgi:hypothetical protein
MEAAGGSNDSAVKAAMARLVLSALADKPVDAVIFMPVDESGTSVPLRITRLEVAGDSLTLTLEPMDPEQRSAVFSEIRRPVKP